MRIKNCTPQEIQNKKELNAQNAIPEILESKCCCFYGCRFQIWEITGTVINISGS